MKKIIALILAVITVLTIALPALAATKTAYVDTSSTDYGTLNLREKKSSTSKVLKTIPHGTKISVTYTNKNDTWYKTSYGGKTGYVMSKFINFSKPNPKTLTEWEKRYGTRTYKVSKTKYEDFKNVQRDLNLFLETFTEVWGNPPKEHHLNWVGYPLKIDGVMGTTSQGAVTIFQQKMKLNADGVVGPATKKALYDWYCSHSNH